MQQRNRVVARVERTGAVGSASDRFDPRQGASSVVALSKSHFHSSICIYVSYVLN